MNLQDREQIQIQVTSLHLKKKLQGLSKLSKNDFNAHLNYHVLPGQFDFTCLIFHNFPQSPSD